MVQHFLFFILNNLKTKQVKETTYKQHTQQANIYLWNHKHYFSYKAENKSHSIASGSNLIPLKVTSYYT